MRHASLTPAAILAALLLAGCEGTGLNALKVGGADPVATGSVSSPPPAAGTPVEAALSGDLPADPVNVGKRHFREGHFGLAEKAYREAVQLSPRDAEAWIGLAASYDRLRRFDLADRAYAQAIRIVGKTSVILNNQGYSYMLRGDLKTARAKLAAALAKDPQNTTILSNIQALDASLSLGKDLR